MAAGRILPVLSWFKEPVGEARAERFWSKVAIAGPADCWDWQGSSRGGGYGRFKVASHVQIAAHRTAWTLHNDRDPGGLIIRHKCDRPVCCNPFHLEIGTHADNVADKYARGRQRFGNHSGERNPRAKLKDADLEAIVAGLKAGRNNKQIAATLPVDHALISRIRVGLSWAAQSRALGWEPRAQFERKPSPTHADRAVAL
jgi:hypothetical protein